MLYADIYIHIYIYIYIYIYIFKIEKRVKEFCKIFVMGGLGVELLMGFSWGLEVDTSTGMNTEVWGGGGVHWTTKSLLVRVVSCFF